MKRTTYIILGLIPGGILLMLIAFYCISFFGTHVDRNPIPYKIGGVMTTVGLNKCKVVKINDITNDSLYRISFDKASLSITSTDGTPSMSYPADWGKRISTKVVADTLIINFNMKDIYSKDDKGIYRLYDINSLPIRININSSATFSFINTSIISNNFDKLHNDSIMIKAKGNVALYNSYIRSLDVNATMINFKSGKIENLYMNTDNVNRWNNDAQNFIINNAFISGTESHTINIDGIKQIHWIPLSMDASLCIKGKSKDRIKICAE